MVVHVKGCMLKIWVHAAALWPAASQGIACRYDEPGAWYAMLPLEIVYAFDPIPPPPPEYLTLADSFEPESERSVNHPHHTSHPDMEASCN